MTSIPPDWGNLVSVSSSSLYPELVQLWFQDATGNVRMVVYSVEANRFLQVTMIRAH